MSDEVAQLSERERQILTLLADGATNQQIAHNLGISINTVKVHVRNIFGKVGAASRTEATVYAIRHGLVQVAEPPIASEPPPVAKTTTPLAGDPTSDTSPPPVALSVGAAPPNEPTPVSLTPAQPTNAPPPTPSTRRGLFGHPSMVAAIIGVVGLLLAVVLYSLLNPSSVFNQNTTTNDVPTSAPAATVANDSATAAAPTAMPPTNNPTLPLNPAGPEFSWQQLAEPPVNTSAAATTNLQGLLLVIGGSTPDGTTRDAWRYDPDNEAWRPIAPRPIAASFAHATELNGLVYVPGGAIAPDEVSAALDVYDPRTDSWQTAATMPAPRTGYALATLNGLLYLFGGFDGEAYHDNVWQYDPVVDAWRELAPMPEPRAFGGAAVNGGRVVLVGGENATGALTRNAVYLPGIGDDESGTWQTDALASLPGERTRFSLVNLGDYLVLVGGETEAAPLAYNLRTATWQTFAEPPGATGVAPAMVVRDSALLVLSGNLPDTLPPALYQLRLIYTIVIPPQ